MKWSVEKQVLMNMVQATSQKLLFFSALVTLNILIDQVQESHPLQTLTETVKTAMTNPTVFMEEIGVSENA